MSEENSSGGKKTFQVVDRRRFDSEGRERQAEEPIPQPTPASSSAPQVPPTAAAATSEQSGQAADLKGDQEIAQQFRMQSGEVEEGDVSFMSFLMSLATQALVQIGEMEPPEGMEIPVDPEAGRQTIDILTMLQRKTRGNLTGDEARFLEEVVHSLRMSFVRRSRQPGK
jgi:hypothetical protein